MLQAALAAWPVDVAIEAVRQPDRLGFAAGGRGCLPPASSCGRSGKRAGVLHTLEERLRRLPVPVIGRIADDALRLDLRCLAAAEEQEFAAQLAYVGSPK